MKITIEVTQEELDEMNFDNSVELEDYAIESLDDGGINGIVDLSPYNVNVKIVDDKVI